MTASAIIVPRASRLAFIKVSRVFQKSGYLIDNDSHDAACRDSKSRAINGNCAAIHDSAADPIRGNNSRGFREPGALKTPSFSLSHLAIHLQPNSIYVSVTFPEKVLVRSATRERREIAANPLVVVFSLFHPRDSTSKLRSRGARARAIIIIVI